MKQDFIERVKKSCFELKRQRFFQNVPETTEDERDGRKELMREKCGHNCKMQRMQTAWELRAAAMKKIAASDVNTHAFTEPEKSRVEITLIISILCEPYYS
jgi:hypothetical protein